MPHTRFMRRSLPEDLNFCNSDHYNEHLGTEIAGGKHSLNILILPFHPTQIAKQTGTNRRIEWGTTALVTKFEPPPPGQVHIELTTVSRHHQPATYINQVSQDSQLDTCECYRAQSIKMVEHWQEYPRVLTSDSTTFWWSVFKACQCVAGYLNKFIAIYLI